MLKYLFVDIDNALTDGYINISTDKKGSKNYFRKDLSALANIRDLGITVIAINEVDDECDHYLRDFGVVDYVRSGNNKIELVMDFFADHDPEEAAYIGTEIRLRIIPNISCIACPQDASKEVHKNADFLCDNKAGHGAVAEFCENIEKVEKWKQNNEMETK